MFVYKPFRPGAGGGGGELPELICDGYAFGKK